MRAKLIKAIIVAAGSSKRINKALPKQLIQIRHRPLLTYTLDHFEKSQCIDSIVLVVPKKYIVQCYDIVKRYKYKKVGQVIVGGRTRQQSVFNGLKSAGKCDYVIVHDGVRPFVNQAIISRVVKAVKRFAAVSCAVRSTDTIVEAKGQTIVRCPKRDRLWHIQTPQAFRFNLLYHAHRKAIDAGIFDATDDSQLLLRLKKKVRLIEGSYKNIKITTISDLRLLQKL